MRLRTRYCSARHARRHYGVGVLFPYDPVHQTFVNVYEGDELVTQAILDQGRTEFEHTTGTRQGTLAVIRKFVASGIHHILIGPDHMLFLVGLLLLGGTVRRLIVVVSAFTLAHSITLSLAALNIFDPPARIVEPAIALSIVFIGVDNLIVRGGRDVRGWIAFAFGFVHGFGFAGRAAGDGAREPRARLVAALVQLGVEIGQLFVVIVVATALAALRTRSETAGRRLAIRRVDWRHRRRHILVLRTGLLSWRSWHETRTHSRDAHRRRAGSRLPRRRSRRRRRHRRRRLSRSTS